MQRAGRSPDDFSSIVLVSKDAAYSKSEAAMRIWQLMDPPFSAIGWLGLTLVPRPTGTCT